MQTILSEEELYDMGLEPPYLEDGEIYMSYYSNPVGYTSITIPENGTRLPVFPVMGPTVPFPGQILQLSAYTQFERKTVMEAFSSGAPLFLGVSTDQCLSQDMSIPITERVCEFGVVAKVVEVNADREENMLLVSLLCGQLAKIDVKNTLKLKKPKPFEAFLLPAETLSPEPSSRMHPRLFDIYIKMKVYLEELGGPYCMVLLKLMRLCKKYSDELLVNFIALHSPCERLIKYSLLTLSFEAKLETLDMSIEDAISEIGIRKEVASKTSEQISQQQRDNFLRHQMEAIKCELGENYEENTDISELSRRAEQMKWDDGTMRYFQKELKKMERFNISMPEYSIQYNYLDMLLNLPWHRYSNPKFTLTEVRATLDEDHYGLEKVKERIIEHMAVHKLRGDMKAPILCLAGAPGVGKTSLGKSIAKALGRDYYRISLGGVSDEAEIRGHRRTYVGAMPGRIMTALSKCENGNPVILLDEIDKIGKGLKGDPAQALLEVLDPEQNSTFHDNYIDLDYDLSNVFFIATANTLADVSGPLLDRMEVIELSGYVLEEKVEIALQHLLPKNLKVNGFEEKEVEFTKEAVKTLVESYTRESGVRSLEKKIKAVLRKIACLKVDGMEYPRQVTPEIIRSLLGKEEIYREAYEDNSYSGVVTGLAWTAAGGEVLFIETSISKGKGDKLTLTGNLGNVMKESASLALEYLRSHPQQIGLTADDFKDKDVHLHVPEGAVPKDGPSAGITMTVSIASALTQRKVKEKLAMTGEMTLRGKVLPVGGIKEKILAARRAGIKEIILSSQNRKDVDEIPDKYIEGLVFKYVDHVSEVLAHSLLEEKADH